MSPRDHDDPTSSAINPHNIWHHMWCHTVTCSWFNAQKKSRKEYSAHKVICRHTKCMYLIWVIHAWLPICHFCVWLILGALAINIAYILAILSLWIWNVSDEWCSAFWFESDCLPAIHVTIDPQIQLWTAVVPFHLETAIHVILSQGVGLTCPKAQGSESISARMMKQYAADPSSSVAASWKQVQKDLVTAVHNEQHMCPIQV